MVFAPLTGATVRSALALVVPAEAIDVVFGTVALFYVVSVPIFLLVVSAALAVSLWRVPVTLRSVSGELGSGKAMGDFSCLGKAMGGISGAGCGVVRCPSGYYIRELREAPWGGLLLFRCSFGGQCR